MPENPDVHLRRVLIVDTALPHGQAYWFDNRDQLMLVELTGQEGISVPFFYDLTMARNPDLPDVDPADMVGTMVRFGIARWEILPAHATHDYYVLRTGMILHFEKLEKYDNAGGLGDTSLMLYKAHVVPSFFMLGRETRFRIFEDLSPVDILKQVLEEMQDRCPNHFRYNISSLHQELGKYGERFPKMEYCVQFGESTYTFLCRLMNRFNMHYYFDNDLGQKSLPPLMQNANQTLFVGAFPNVPSRRTDIKSYHLTDDDPTTFAIAGFQRHFEPQFRKTWFGNFSIIDPTHPPMHTEQRSSNFDLLSGRSDVASYAVSESFPAPFVDKSEATDYAIGQGLQQEEQEFSVSGGSKNPGLIAGRRIEIVESGEQKADGDYLLKVVILKAFEHSYLTNSWTDACNFIFRDFLFAPFKKKKNPGRDTADLTVSIVNAGLNNYLQNQQAQVFNTPFFGGSGDPKDDIYHNFGPFFLGGITQVGITGAVSLLVDTVESALNANAGEFSNTFVALPRTGEIFRVPSPSAAPRPIAYGPHTALVIGPEGIDTKKQDIYCDALGRVRVRFPWDPGRPKGKSSLPPSWTAQDTTSDYPLHHDDNTCWVRVSEGWAGRHYGTQFLPRIGQEVIVDFIAGDPERPIITGRVYNADKGTTNLPFPDPSEENTTLKHRPDDRPAPPVPLSSTVHSDLLLSGIKTWSIPTTDEKGIPKSKRFQLLRFSDKREHEQYLIRAQHRLDITAYQTRYETIHLDRHLTVGGKKKNSDSGTGTTSAGGGGSQSANIVGDYITKIYRDYHLHVGDPEYKDESGNRTTLLEQTDALHVKKDSKLVVDGGSSASVGNFYLHSVKGQNGGGKYTLIVDDNDELQVKGDYNQMISGNWSTALSKQMSVRSDTTIVLEAFSNLTLVVGSSSIVLTPAAISITSPMVLINSGGAPPASPIVPPSPTVADPSIDPPKDPKPADPGNSLTPPD
jgi:uncharacterized protein involved in type VI secretion and phage assembly